MKSKLSELSKRLSHITFDIRANYLFDSSLSFLRSKYGEGKDDFAKNFPFILNSFLELSIRAGESVIVPYAKSEVAKIFDESNEVLFHSQNQMLSNDKILRNFGIFYSLWEFEEQEDIFLKFFRYNFFFNFANESIDMKAIFKNAFGTEYKDYLDFCYCVLAISISSDVNKFWEFFSFIDKIFFRVKSGLTIDYDDYLKNSIKFCPNVDYIALSLKISHSYPFLDYKNKIYLPLPHACLTACTKSLLYRLTLGNNDLREKIGKNVLENYVFDIVEKSNIYDRVCPEVCFNKKKKILSSDVLCFKNNEMLAIECKLITPSVEVRYLDEEALIEHKDKVVSFICQLYKSLFIDYSVKDNGLPFIEREKRYGIVLLF